MTGAKRPHDAPDDGMTGRGATAGRPSASPAATPGSLYERYKDALRRGHVAALRGRHDAAIDAYGEAAAIAPDRALPHASIGGILAKMNRPADAVAAYRRALDLAPRDETALRGIAEVLTRLGRRAEAAAALDRLAEGLDAAGRLADAADIARRALELAESRPRRRQLETLADRLRAVTRPDEAAVRALADADRVLGRDARRSTVEDVARAEEPADRDVTPIPESPVDAGVIADGDATAGAAPPADAEVVETADPQEFEAPPVAEPAGLGIALGAAAEAQLYAGDLADARDGLLAAARAHRRAGRLVAAVDACDLAIAIAPADPDLHLLLAELYLDRGWRALAAEKLLLLGRIATLDGDAATRERLCSIASARLPEESRLTELCA
jgi:tetratricopeptide (TPR) repeat protein